MVITYGVDLSHQNPDVDLHQLVNAGSLAFIALKATEGTNFVDPAFVDRFQRIVRYLPDTLVLAYHFLRTDSSATDQMKHFHDVLASVGYFDHDQALAGAIDAERGLQGQEPSRALTAAAVNAYRVFSGHAPGLYSGDSYWQDHFVGLTGLRYAWVARYSSNRPKTHFDIWQDSDRRVIAGHAYDHNVFYGTPEQFRDMCGR